MLGKPGTQVFRGSPARNVGFLFALLLAAGCGTLSYKLGGSGADYEAASKRCREQGREGAAYEQCLREQGWGSKQLGVAPATSAAAPAAPAAAVEAKPPPAPPAAGAAPAAGAPPPAEPGRPVVVESWFKLGGTADDLAAARRRCQTKLGAAARVEAGSDAVTREMLGCLEGEGWRALLAR